MFRHILAGICNKIESIFPHLRQSRSLPVITLMLQDYFYQLCLLDRRHPPLRIIPQRMSCIYY